MQTVLTRAISTKNPEIVHLLMKDPRTQAIKSTPVSLFLGDALMFLTMRRIKKGQVGV